jgi:hypothetical protein
VPFIPDVIWKEPVNNSLMDDTVVEVEFATELAARLRNASTGTATGTALKICEIDTEVFTSVIVVAVLVPFAEKLVVLTFPFCEKLRMGMAWAADTIPNAARAAVA